MKKLFFAIFLSLSLAVPVYANKELPKTPPKLNLGETMPANLFVELAKAINPAVVNISTTAIPKNNPRLRDPMLDMLEQLYGLRMQQPPQQQRRPQQMGLGTGFIIREDGLIITNNHVIKGADVINVQLSEKSAEVYEATLVGSDERTDIALIKITPKKNKLPVAVLGNSKELQVGEWVAAFGNPFGHGHTMTKGIVSSLGRDISEINKLPLIQTDASINPGNSGGPLVNTKGQVIGVNSAIDARAQGIGFAIPIDEVKELIPILEKDGRVSRGFLGVALGDIDDETAAYLGLGDNRGAVVTAINPGSPAAKAGFKTYDIVTEFNGKKVRNSLELMDAVADSPVGKAVDVKAIRENKEVKMKVTTAVRTDEIAKPAAPRKTYVGQKAPFNLGFSLIDPTAELRKEWNLPEDLKQPIVIETERNSLASKAGIRVGDIILDVNRKNVRTSKDVLSSLQKGSNVLRVARNNRILIITLQ